MTKCQKCQAQVPPEEIREHAGRQLCEDCYMDALSPARACDPWAVYTARRLTEQVLNPAQEAILALIDKQGWARAEELRQATGLEQAALERELAALRHRELVGATLASDGGKLFTRFGAPGKTAH